MSPTRRLAAAALLAVALVVPAASPSHAGEPPPDQGAANLLATSCNRDVTAGVDEGTADISARIRVFEYGKHAVRRFKVEFLVYNTSGSGFQSAIRRKTFQSNQFPDNKKNFTFDTGFAWNDVPTGEQGLRMIAKITWDRDDRRDWNSKELVAFCQ